MATIIFVASIAQNLARLVTVTKRPGLSVQLCRTPPALGARTILGQQRSKARPAAETSSVCSGNDGSFKFARGLNGIPKNLSRVSVLVTLNFNLVSNALNCQCPHRP